MDFAAIRSRLAGSDGRLYWRSLSELADTPDFRDYLHREFPEQASEWNDPKGRRNFLKLMSASLALAGVGACTRQPPENIVPYVRQPEDLVPGRPLFFASAIPLGGVARPVLVESHMGRPTKIEGNPEHPASLGATDSLTQAAVLGLYDPDRSQTVTYRGEVRPWSAYQSAIQSALTAQKATQGAGLRILTRAHHLAVARGTASRRFCRTTRKPRWHQYDPVATDGGRLGLRQATGAPTDAVYHLDKADVVVSLDADFLGFGPSMVRYTRDFADRRRVTDDAKQMNRLYVIESSPTLDRGEGRAPAADPIVGYRRHLRAVSLPQSARADRPARPAAIRTKPSGWPPSPRTCRPIAAGRSSWPASSSRRRYTRSRTPSIRRSETSARQSLTADLSSHSRSASTPRSFELSTAMEAGQVQLLLILGNNPVFTAPADVKFGERLSKVGLVVYHSLYQDETSELAHWNIPETHPLETWGDPRAYDGTVTLMQPLIAPLYDAHSAHEVIATLTSQRGRKTLDHRQGLLDARVRRRHGMDDPQRRRRVVRQCRRLLEAGRARRVHSRHRDRDGWAGHAVQAGSCRVSQRQPRPRSARSDARRRGTGITSGIDAGGRSGADPAPTAPGRSHRPQADSSWCSGPIRWSGTAASPTTAGCRKRPSR